MTSTLVINEYLLWCHLGCLLEEREQAQEVLASIKIEFNDPPVACVSDHLEDTICYARLCEEMDCIAKERSFNTIEHLSWVIYSNIQKYFPNQCRWSLVVKKVRPPIDGLKNGVCFQIGDLT